VRTSYLKNSEPPRTIKNGVAMPMGSPVANLAEGCGGLLCMAASSHNTE
jgi:hypothetical protein